MTTEIKLKDISQKEGTVILSLDMGKVTNRVKVDANSDAVTTEIDRKMLHVGVDLFDSKELRACQTFQARLKKGILRKCVPSFLKGGMYMVKLQAVEQVDTMLCEAQEPFKALVTAFADVIDLRREESKERLGLAYNESAYPCREEVFEKFLIEWQWLIVGTPSSLKAISRSFFNREKQKAEDAIKNATESITIMLAQEAKKLGDHLVERLTPDIDGNPKKFKKNSIENISEFLETFNLRNIGTSDELNQQVERIKGLVTGLDAKSLRDDEKLRKDVSISFNEVSAALDKLIMETPGRFMDVE